MFGARFYISEMKIPSLFHVIYVQSFSKPKFKFPISILYTNEAYQSIDSVEFLFREPVYLFCFQTHALSDFGFIEVSR